MDLPAGQVAMCAALRHAGYEVDVCQPPPIIAGKCLEGGP